MNWRRCSLWAGCALLLLVTLAGISLAWLSSAAGARALVSYVDRIDGLELDYAGGSLGDELWLSRLRFNTDDGEIVIALDHVRAELDWSCLWQGRICLERLSAEFVDIAVYDLGAEDDPDDDFLWDLPLALSSNAVSVELLYIHWAGGEIRSGLIEGAARLAGEEIRILSANSLDARLVIFEESVDIDLEAPVEMPDVDLPLLLVVEEATLQQPAWSIDGLPQNYRRIEVSGRWRGDLMEIERGKVVSDDWGRGELQGNLRYRHPYTTRASVEVSLLEPEFWDVLDGSEGRLQLSGAFDSLDFSGSLCGSLPVSFEGKVDIVSREKPFEARLTEGCESSAKQALELSGLPGLESLPVLTLAPGWSLSAVGNAERQMLAARAVLGGLGYESASVDLQMNHVSGMAGLDSLRIDLDGAGRLELAGTLAYVGELRWDLGGRAADLVLTEEVSGFNGLLSGPFVASGTWRDPDLAFKLEQLDLSGELNGLPFKLAGQLQLDELLDPAGSDLELLLNGTRAELEARGDGLPRAAIRGDDLSLWLKGARGQFKVDMQWQRETDTLLWQGALAEFAWTQLQGRKLEFSGRHALVGERDTQLELFASQLRIAGLEFPSLRLEGAGGRQNHRASMMLEGSLTGELGIEGGFHDEGWTGQFQPATLAADIGIWRLDETVELSYSHVTADLQVRPHCWDDDLTEFCLRQARLGESGELRLDFEGGLDSFSAFLPDSFSLSGAVSGHAEAIWEAMTAQRIELSLAAPGGSLREFIDGRPTAEFSWDDMKLAYSGNPQDGRLQAQVRRGNKRTLDVDLLLPAAADGDLSGKVVLDTLDLRQLQAFPDSFNRFEGLLSGELAFGGQVGRPLVRGDLSLDQALFSLKGNPTEVILPSLAFSFKGESADVAGTLQAGPGRSDLSGTLHWLDEPRLELAISGERKSLLIAPSTEIGVEEDLVAIATPALISLNGQVTIPDAVLEFDQLPEEGVALSDDVVLVDYTGIPIQETQPVDTELNLQLDIANRFRVISSLFEARLGGQLRVIQDRGKPLELFGTLAISELRLESLGRNLSLVRGNIAFVGDPSEPQIDAQLEREITEDQVTAGVRVMGTLSEPRFEYYSRPSLPEAEIMAYILSGRRIDRTGETDSLALALAMTSGLAQSRGLLGNFSLGVEGSDQNTRAAIGGYISERIYLSYGIGIYQPVNTVTVRLDLLRNMWMEVVSGLQNSADVYYAWSIK